MRFVNHRGMLMPYTIIVIACLGLLFSFYGLHSSTIQHYDHFVVAWMNSERFTILDRIAQFLSFTGGLPALLLCSFILAVSLKKTQRNTMIPLILSAVVGSASIGWLMKSLINRPRPDMSYVLVESYGASFPSAHSLYAAILASLCILIWSQHTYARMVFIIANVWWLSMGISRIYLGVHYPTDVLAGWSLGFLWIALMWLFLPQLELLKNKYFRL